MARRKFKPEFKRQVVEEWRSGQRRIAEVCRRYQLSDTLVRRWRQELEVRGLDAWKSSSPDSGELVAAQRRVAELEAALGRSSTGPDGRTSRGGGRPGDRPSLADIRDR